jgi:hypothetical protein
MAWPAAIGVTILLFAASAMGANTLGFNPTPLVVVATALWAAIDSSKLGLQKYRSGIAHRPAVLFLGISLLWIVGFPWYLIARGKIRSGQLPLREAAASPSAA